MKFFWKNQHLQNIKNKYDLSSYISEIMSQIYKYYPIVNNELINKDKPTTISRRARNKVIDLMLKNTEDIREHLGTAQESFMFDTLFRTTEIFNETQHRFNFNCKRFEKVFKEIINFFSEALDEFKDFSKLIHRLAAPHYGIAKVLCP